MQFNIGYEELSLRTRPGVSYYLQLLLSWVGIDGWMDPGGLLRVKLPPIGLERKKRWPETLLACQGRHVFLWSVGSTTVSFGVFSHMNPTDVYHTIRRTKEISTGKKNDGFALTSRFRVFFF